MADKSRRPAGSPQSTGGQFAVEAKTEVPSALPVQGPKGRVKAILDRLPHAEGVKLTKATKGMVLPDKVLDMLLWGEEDQAREEVVQMFLPEEGEAASELIDKAAGELDIDPYTLSLDEGEELVEHLQKIDTATTFDDLYEATPPQPLRIPLADFGDSPFAMQHIAREWWQDREGAGNFSAGDVRLCRRQVLRSMVSEYGIDHTDPDVQDALMSLVDKSPDHWGDHLTFDVVWTGDVRAAAMDTDTHLAAGQATFALTDKSTRERFASTYPVPALTLPPRFGKPAHLDKAGW